MEYKILNIDGTEYKTLFTKKFTNRKRWTPSAANEIKATIPGTVLKLNVRNGDKVKEGDVLLLFEAMKMQNIILAPCAGEITNLEAKEGDALPKGAVILTIK
ncbi:MAG: acetyl-CoA carboxylase biotin carboxyl carrier protein subunit [Prevotellaceae bacterium]|jgi:biotin carboxyl carrier protein|nr:acetyl-CoA carboxylase biotin carboxyl carrier protein subunit [Prevotellaceae bacterium]